MEPSLAPQCLLVFDYFGLQRLGIIWMGPHMACVVWCWKPWRKVVSFPEQEYCLRWAFRSHRAPFGLLTWELANLGLSTGDATVCTSRPLGNLCARRVFALVTWVGSLAWALFSTALFFFLNPVLSEKHDSQNFTNAVAMLVREASHAVEVAGHTGWSSPRLCSYCLKCLPLYLSAASLGPLSLLPDHYRLSLWCRRSWGVGRSRVDYVFSSPILHQMLRGHFFTCHCVRPFKTVFPTLWLKWNSWGKKLENTEKD